MKKTVILGASPNPIRYSYMAAELLKEKEIPFVPVGIKPGEVFGEEILDIREFPEIPDVHTVTLYMSAKNQEPYYDYIRSLKPKRVIFNPGAENKEFAAELEKENIEARNYCNLVMLRTGLF
ncbi:hypothetical protein A3SI_05519 [Nitritalea halalkaliphila LW7]|uniref:CoA-binding domain-containing protein n=1 Tax=Nitritalea halalkaliphila LW7 TaxID=1189621 RepID=I5C7L5_9BACT|nr:CoA-binding protein [Nitritalea halalkaliphila]EIM77817.1 hypothetical protein A3SI_05519 [Nitritalea halalkaliphila LW7]